MKKIITLSMLSFGLSIMAQTKTLVTINGEKIAYPPVTTNTLTSAGNILTSNVNGVSSSASMPIVSTVSNIVTGSLLSTTVNGITGATVDLSAAEPWRVQGGTVPATLNTENIYQLGKVAIGATAGTGVNSKDFAVYGDAAISKTLEVDGSDAGDGSIRSGIFFGSGISGEGISCNRFANGNGNRFGLDFWTNSVKRLSIDQSGNVGIGTNFPTAKLEVNGGSVKIVDGTQADGLVFTSDANGVGSWKASDQFATVSTVNGLPPSVQVDFAVGGASNLLSGYIDLPAGNWALYAGFLINAKIGQFNATQNSSYTGRFTFSTSNSSVSTTGLTFIGSSLILNSTTTGAALIKYPLFVSGCLRVNTTATLTRLYVWNIGSVGCCNGGGNEIGSIGSNGENYIYAIKTQ